MWPGRVDRAEAEVADLDHLVVGDREVVARQHLRVLGGDTDVDPGVAHLGDGLNVVKVSMGGEHPPDARGPGDLEQELVLVRGVDQDGLAGALVAQDEHVVLVRPDDQLVDPDVGGVVVGGPGERARHESRLPLSTLSERREAGIPPNSERGPSGPARAPRAEPAADLETRPVGQVASARHGFRRHARGSGLPSGGARLVGRASERRVRRARAGQRAERRDRLGGARSSGRSCSAPTVGSGSPGPRSTAAGKRTSPSRSSSTRSTRGPTRRRGSRSSVRDSSPRR